MPTSSKRTPVSNCNLHLIPGIPFPALFSLVYLIIHLFISLLECKLHENKDLHILCLLLLP